MNEYLKRNYQGCTNEAEIERMQRYLRRGIQLLAPRQQQVVKMYYIDDLNETQIAEVLNVSQPNISKTLKAALKSMRRNITISLHFQDL